MIRIPCPHCGLRDQTEYHYGGDGTVKRPADDAPLEAWNHFVYTRENPRGLHIELWQHAAGCREWIRVLRDTTTHKVLASGTMSDDLEAERKKAETNS